MLGDIPGVILDTVNTEYMDMELLAKCNGISLKEHSMAVSDRAAELAMMIGCDERTVKLCRVAGLLHDIGKSLPCFQSYIRNPNGKTEDELTSDPDKKAKFFPHNEMSALFIECNRASVRDAFGLDDKGVATVELAVLTHHAYRPGVAFNLDDNGAIKPGMISTVTANEYDNAVMVAAFHEISGIAIDPCSTENKEVKLPFLSCAIDRASVEHIVRAVLIRADWDVSSGIVYCRGQWPVFGQADFAECPEEYDSVRYSRQVGIAFDSGRKSTSVYNAPAGFGKTLLGIMLLLQSDRHAMWVCPRNEVCRSVFEAIREDLRILATMDKKFAEISVELYTTGMRQDSFAGDRKLSDSEPARITVTNIDHCTQPMACGRQGGLQLSMLDSVAVFDEYHEFVTESPMFFAFAVMLRAHHVLGVSQYLLSATPVETVYKWAADDLLDIRFYPEARRHFPAQHGIAYDCSMTRQHPETLEPGTFAIFNSVKAAQAVSGDVICYHSYFTDEDAKAKRELIGRLYGKHSTEQCKTPVASGPIIQASADYSARKLYDSVFSMTSTLQRIGRCNRHGEYESSEVVFIDSSDRGELTAISNMYDTGLRDRWVKFVADEFDGKKLTLDSMYVLYDRFMTETTRELSEYEERLLDASHRMLVTRALAVRRATRETMSKDDYDRYLACANGSIRDPQPSFYYIVKDEGSDRYYMFSETSSVLERQEIYDNGFGHYSKDSDRVLRAIGAQLASPVNEGRFDYLAQRLGAIPGAASKQVKNFMKCLYSPKRILSLCRWEKTPFPVRPIDMHYSHDRGVVKTVKG